MTQAATPIRITAEPLDARRCKFLLNRPVHAPGARTYASADDAADAPVAQAVLAVPGVCEVVASGNVLTVVQDGARPWSALEPLVHYAVETAVVASTPGPSASSPAAAVSPSSDDAMFDRVSDIFDSQINPSVAQHGGKVELLDVQDGFVVLRMMGGCQGCGMANVTLRQGIEASLRRAIPSVKGIRDITDHAAGANPYFASGTK